MELVKDAGGLQLCGIYEEDLSVGAKIREAAESLQFMLGDWVLAMTEKHEESVRTLAADMTAVTGVPANTLREYARVSRAFPADKRVSTSTWSHHRAAATGDRPVTTLKSAEKQGLSVRDTERLAKGLPLGGSDTAKAQSSAAPKTGDLNLEEIVLADIKSAKEYLARAVATMSKPGFRLDVYVGQDILDGLKACAAPFKAIEAAVEEECGAVLR